MFKRRDKEGIGPIDTLVGKNASVHGDIEFFGGLHIDGRVLGNVRAGSGADASLSVSEDGVIEMAQGAEISGKLVPRNGLAVVPPK